MKIKQRKRWRNTIRHESVQPVQLITAETFDDLSRIIQSAATEKFKVRCVGSGHSFNDVACTHGYLVSIDALNKVLELPTYVKQLENKEKQYIQVEAGMTIRELNNQLDKRNLSIINMGGIDHQTLAGAISTGTHGSGIELPPVHGMVKSMVLVAGDGKIYRIEPANGISNPALFNETGITLVQNDDDFYSALVSLGSMGIIYSFILEVVESYWLEEKKVTAKWSEIKPKLKDGSLMKEARHVMVLVNPYETDGDHCCLITRINPIKKPENTLWPDTRNFVITHMSEWRITYWIAWLLFRLLMKRTPKNINSLMKFMVDKSFTGKSYDVLFQGLQFVKERSFDCEFAFKIDGNSFLDCLDNLFITAQRFADKGNIYQSSPIGLRFVKGGPVYLSPEYKYDVCYIDTPVMNGTVGANELLEAYQENMFACGGFPHWGKKNFKLSAHLEKIETRFEKLATWKAVRSKYDPGKLFTNEYMERFQLF